MLDAHRTPHTHLHEDQDLLPGGQVAQLHGLEATVRERADTHEECVNIIDMLSSVTRIEDTREKQRQERASKLG